MDHSGIPAIADALLGGVPVERSIVADAVRTALAEVASRNPGKAAELRVAPFGAVQVLEGHVHRRGTPSTVVSIDPAMFLGLWCGQLSIDNVNESSRTSVSGTRGDDALAAIPRS